MEKNYEWLVEDINDSYRLKIFYKDSDGNKRYATYVATNINRLDNLEIEAVSGNVQDIENLISGMVRFVNEIDESKILDIPLRNIYMLSALHGSNIVEKLILKNCKVLLQWILKRLKFII